MRTYVLVAIVVNCIYHGHALPDRKDRMFSLFNVVKFRNTQCQATSSTALRGTCFTAQECTDKSGTSNGNCAASFGVCCVFRVSTCGAQASENCTFIENPGFPAVTTNTGACAYTIVPNSATDICQIRFDFTTVTLLQPAGATGVCTDNLVILGGATPTTSIGLIPPTLCGTLTNQHLYVESARASPAATVNFNIAAPTNEMYRVKVSHIECTSRYAPPNGCLQWLMGNTGTITSFNFDGDSTCATGCHLHNQFYTACFRQEPGMCAIQFVETNIAAPMNAFLLSIGAVGPPPVAIADTTCTESYILIRASNKASFASGDRYCGDIFSPVVDNAITSLPMVTTMNMATQAGAVTSTRTPFELRVFAGSNANAAPNPQNMLAGFSLDFTQIPCGNPQVE